MKLTLILALALCAYAQTKAPKVPKHWVVLRDSARAQVCVRDSDGLILAKAFEQYPTLEPGVWYAVDANDAEWGHYPSRLLALREVERRLGGCPGFTPLEDQNAKR